MHTASRIVLVGWALCLASIASAQTVVVNASVEIANIYDPEGFLPADLEVGDTGTLELVYRIDAVSGGPINGNQASYFFPTGQLGITYRVGGHVWACSNILSGEVALVNNEPRKRTDTFSASVDDPGGLFPFQVPDGRGQLTAWFRDEALPLDLLHGLVLPTTANDVNFTEVSLTGGTITAIGGAQYWSISFNLHDPKFASTVAVTSNSWGGVKSLYAR